MTRVLAAVWLPTVETAEVVAALLAGLVGLLVLGLLLVVVLAIGVIVWRR